MQVYSCFIWSLISILFEAEKLKKQQKTYFDKQTAGICWAKYTKHNVKCIEAVDKYEPQFLEHFWPNLPLPHL